MRINVAVDGLDEALSAAGSRVFMAVDGEVEAAADGLKTDLRGETEAVLGRRVGFAWRGRYYPNKGDGKGPAAFVWTKAPRIIDFFSADRIVTPLGVAFAIPVSPMVKRGGRVMSVREVEQQIGQRLQGIKLDTGNIGLFANLLRGRNGRGFRAATRGRLAQGRKEELTLMFVLVRRLRSHKLIDLNAIAQRWGAKIATNIERRLSL